MKAQKLKTAVARSGSAKSAITRVLTLAGFIFLAQALPAQADPMLIETGLATGSFWFVLIAGLAVEALILALLIRRTYIESIVVCLLANAISGFIGFVILLFLRIKGIPIVPPGPLTALAILVEAPLVSLMLVRPPIKRIAAGVTTANLVSGALAIIVLGSITMPPPEPTVLEDNALARSISTVRRAIDTYHDEFGFYPAGLTGGRSDSLDSTCRADDPLIAAGILESYPPNPYAPYLRSRRFQPAFLFLGIGRPTRPVDLDDPSNAWEARWFPAMKADSRFGDPDHLLLCANGLSDPQVRDTLESTFYHMNGADCIPGCFFYRSYDFNRDGLPDDYILGAFGWPTGRATVAVDIIDAATGEIHLRLDSQGCVHAGEPDGMPEPVIALHIANPAPPD